MSVRQLVYPNYDAELFEGGDIRLRFVAPGSKWGAVHIVLASADALELLRQLDKALDESDAMLVSEADA